MRCPYCAASVVVPEVLRPPPAQPSAATAAATTRATEANAAIVDHDLRDASTGWSEDDGDGRQGYAQNGYRMRLGDDEWEAWAWHDAAHGADVDIEVTVTKASGPGDTYFGFAARASDGGGYYFVVYADGRYGIWAYAEEDEESGDAIAEGSTRGIVNTGNAGNRIRAVCKGDRLELHVNGKQALSARDDNFTGGYVELVVGREETEEGAIDVSFERVTIRRA